MRWTILGAGAIGTLFASQLKRIGEQVTLLDTRKTQHSSLQLTLTTLDQQTIEQWFDYETDLALPEIDVLLVTTKVWQVIPALTPLIGKLSPRCSIVLLHNGMGTADWVLSHFSENPIMAGVTSAGALKNTKQHVQHTGFGETWLGSLNEQAKLCESIIPPLNQAMGHAAWSDQIKDRQWQKLVINAVINPLTALLNEPNGALLMHQTQVRALCEEVAPLLAKEGLMQTAEQLFTTVMSVAERTANNYSSMQQDIAHQRQTEIDFITGYLLEKAAEHQLALPQHHALYLKIKEKEQAFTHKETT